MSPAPLTPEQYRTIGQALSQVAPRGPTFTHVTTRVLQDVQEVTGCSADLGALDAYERSLLDGLAR